MKRFFLVMNVATFACINFNMWAVQNNVPCISALPDSPIIASAAYYTSADNKFDTSRNDIVCQRPVFYTHDGKPIVKLDADGAWAAGSLDAYLDKQAPLPLVSLVKARKDRWMGGEDFTRLFFYDNNGQLIRSYIWQKESWGEGPFPIIVADSFSQALHQLKEKLDLSSIAFNELAVALAKNSHESVTIGYRQTILGFLAARAYSLFFGE